MADKLEVRVYCSDDERAVVALWSEAFPNPDPWNEPHFVIAKKLATQPDLFFVAVADRWLIYTVAVRPDRQRRGIGSALVRRVEAALEALGCPKLNLQVRASNAAVVAFYERLGYAVEERVSMGKRLGS